MVTNKLSKKTYKTKRNLKKTIKKKNIKYGGNGDKYISFDDTQSELFKINSMNNYEEVESIFYYYYSKNIINEKKLLELNVTLSYLWSLKIYFVIVIFVDSKLTLFNPCINLGKNSIVNSFLTKHEIPFNTIAENLKKDDIYLKGYNLVNTTEAILDKCIIYPIKERNNRLFTENEYYPYVLYLNMFYNLSKTKSFMNKKINTCFLFNLFDNPVVLKKLLKTNSLLTNDSANDYSDKNLIQPDVWMHFLKEKSIKINNNTYKMTNHYTPIDKLIDTYLTINNTELQTKFNIRKEQMIFRGSLTGCNPANINLNTRYKVISYIKENNDEINYDVGITQMQKGIYVENPLYDDDIFNIVSRFSENVIDIINKIKSNMLPIYEIMSGYKFVLSLDGYASAWRLPYELLMGNIVFVITKYDVWFKHLLIDGENCIIIDINNLAQIDIQMKKLIADVSKQYSISNAANNLGRKLLDYNFIMECLEQTVISTKISVLDTIDEQCETI